VKTLKQLADSFQHPPPSYSPVPFWFLNGDMDTEELGRQLRLMHSIGIGTVALHARQGRKVEYLSEEWFAGILYCVDTCASLGMTAWLYDEDNWPSGYAGGEVLSRYPQGRAKCLAMVSAQEAGDAVVHRGGEVAFIQQLTPWHPAYHEGWYTDLLDLRATQAFIETTHERYAQTLGDHLGTTVTAVFTDEPGFYNHFYDCAPGTVVWTGDLPEQFQSRMGYDLLPCLEALFHLEPEDWQAGRKPRQVRVDFYRVVSRLIAERFYGPLRNWCNEHGMQLVGHVNNEEYLVDHVRLNADFFTAMDGLNTPGLDIIAPAGNYRRAADSPVPKLTSSAAHTRDKRQVISETYGATGWELSPEEMRRMADWQSVRGVTRIVPHAFYYSIEGDRYNESPPSLFFQSPHWPYIPALVQYLTRWTWLLESTSPHMQVAVYYPIDAVRACTTPQVPPSLGGGFDEASAGEAGALGLRFARVLDDLFRQQVDFDVVDDVALSRATIEGEALCVGKAAYRCVVIPTGEPSPEASAVIEEARAAGVRIMRPTDSDYGAELSAFRTVTLSPASPQITAVRRDAANGSLFLVVNEGTRKFEGQLTLPLLGELTCWDLGAGLVDTGGAQSTENGLRINLTLLGGASVCFAVRPAD